MNTSSQASSPRQRHHRRHRPRPMPEAGLQGGHHSQLAGTKKTSVHAGLVVKRPLFTEFV